MTEEAEEFLEAVKISKPKPAIDEKKLIALLDRYIKHHESEANPKEDPEAPDAPWQIPYVPSKETVDRHAGAESALRWLKKDILEKRHDLEAEIA